MPLDEKSAPPALELKDDKEKGDKEMAANPAYKNWSSFKKGASVTLKEVATDKSGDDPGSIDATAHPHSATEIYNTFTLQEEEVAEME